MAVDPNLLLRLVQMSPQLIHTLFQAGKFDSMGGDVVPTRYGDLSAKGILQMASDRQYDMPLLNSRIRDTASEYGTEDSLLFSSPKAALPVAADNELINLANDFLDTPGANAFFGATQFPSDRVPDIDPTSSDKKLLDLYLQLTRNGATSGPPAAISVLNMIDSHQTPYK